MTLTAPSTTTSDSDGATGLFIVSYRIGGDKPGAPALTAHLTVNTVSKDVTGLGEIGWAVSPPVDLDTKLNGEFTYMTVMPNTSHILVTLTGYPVVRFGGGGIGPVILPNAQVRMVLGDDWASGTAAVRFTTDGQNWQDFTDLPVGRIASPSPEDLPGAGLPTIVLTPETVTASWSGGKLVIHASGQEDGVTKIRVRPVANELVPPEYSIVGVPTPAIGMFPYHVEGTFNVGSKPREIVIVSPTKNIHVPVS